MSVAPRSRPNFGNVRRTGRRCFLDGNIIKAFRTSKEKSPQSPHIRRRAHLRFCNGEIQIRTKSHLQRAIQATCPRSHIFLARVQRSIHDCENVDTIVRPIPILLSFGGPVGSSKQLSFFVLPWLGSLLTLQVGDISYDPRPSSFSAV